MAVKQSKDLKKILAQLPKRIYNKRILTRLANRAHDLIYDRVKRGFGVSSDTRPEPKQERLKGLSDSYKDFRRGKVVFFVGEQGQTYGLNKKQARKSGIKIERPRLGDRGTPAKSNLTFTGELLDSIEAKVRKKRKSGTILLRIPNSRRSDGKTNAQVAGWVRDERPFFALTKKETRVILREWERVVRRFIRILVNK